MRMCILLLIHGLDQFLPLFEKKMASVDSTFKNDAMQFDISTCLNGKDKPTKRLYICPKTYPPPKSSSEQIPNNHTSWIHLKHDVEKSTLASGNLILSNRGRGRCLVNTADFSNVHIVIVKRGSQGQSNQLRRCL